MVKVEVGSLGVKCCLLLLPRPGGGGVRLMSRVASGLPLLAIPPEGTSLCAPPGMLLRLSGRVPSYQLSCLIQGLLGSSMSANHHYHPPDSALVVPKMAGDVLR